MSGTNVSEIATRSFVIAVLVAIGAGCNANFPESPTPTPSLASIQLHYNSPHSSVTVGNTVGVTLYAINSEGIFENVTSRASWISVNPEFASVTPGVARGVRGGTTDVIATYGGMTATARIVVVFQGDILGSMTLRPPSSMSVGQTAQARAIIGAGTTSIDVTDRAVWTSSNPSVMTVSAGVITPVGPGTAAISATLDVLTKATYYASVPPIRSVPPLP